MNRPDYFSFLNSFSNPDSARDTLTYLADLSEKLRPTDATTQMVAALLAELSSRLVYLVASLPTPLLLVVALVASISVLRLVNRVVSFVTRLVFRLVFWAAVAGLVAVMYEKGLEGSLAAGRELCAYVFDIVAFFWKEWERFERERDGKPRPNLRF
ncbi:hypothetical protein VUR80DRAFT_7119 [Thermomyces stellatus]